MIAIEVRPEAQVEIQEAFAWYEEQRRGLGHQFLLSLDALVDRIRRQPRAFPMIEESLRRALLRRFPYALLFELESNRATIIAVFHVRRKPGGWSDRVREPAEAIYAGGS